MVQLYDHNFKLLVWPWKLLSVILKPLQRRWNVKTSLDVFASFIYLSSTRLLVTSLNFLFYSSTYTYQQGPDGHMKLTKVHHLFYAPSVEYFAKNHLPFALMAIFLSLVFFVFPMVLLFVYPFACFQQILNKIGLNSLTLRTFVEVFQGPFKDGANNTRGYRYFSGFLLLIPLIVQSTYAVIPSNMYFSVASIWILIYLSLHLVYKRSLHNYITIPTLMFLLACHLSLAINSEAATVILSGEMVLKNVLHFYRVLLFSIILLLLSISIAFLYVFSLLCFLIILRVHHK